MTVADAFIEKTGFEGNSCLAWTYTVLNYVLQQSFSQEGGQYLAGLPQTTREAVSDAYHVVDQSGPVFKEMLRLLKYASKSQLMSFLRKIHRLLHNCATGHILLLPALVESKELLLLLHRTTDTTFKLVVIHSSALQISRDWTAPNCSNYYNAVA